ncbi:MAG: MCE family protein [Thermoleophilaceae bacterium]|nr:MCE family protein [Thermoleophilaceae bacterium]
MRRQGIADNPILIGTGTIFVVLVMVMLSYNANEGLPFVPTYNIKAELRGGANLVTGNEVRIGGARVGVVAAITPKYRDGTYYAEIDMHLDQKIAEIPVDSKIVVRPRSTIGLKYVQLTEGHSSKTIPEGGTLPVNRSFTASEFDDLLNTLPKVVRDNYRRVLVEFGDGLAGRGGDVNNAIGDIDPLARNVTPFFRMLSAPSTGFERFILALSRAAGDFAPVADQGAELWVNADITFAGFASATDGIQQTLAASPDALQTYTEEFPKQRYYLKNLTTLMTAFDKSAPYLPTVSHNMAVITDEGTPALNHLYKSLPAFERTFMDFGEFAGDPMVSLGLKSLVTFNRVLNQPLSFITPSQSKCNYPGILVRNIASAVSDRGEAAGGLSSWLRFNAIVGFSGLNSEGGPAAGISNFQTNTVQKGFLHSNAYPKASSPGEVAQCAAGNEVTRGKKNPGPGFLTPAPLVGSPDGLGGTKTENTGPVNKDVVK